MAGTKNLVAKTLTVGDPAWVPNPANYSTLTWLTISPKDPSVATTFVITLSEIDTKVSVAIEVKKQAWTMPENHAVNIASILSVECTLGAINIVGLV